MKRYKSKFEEDNSGYKELKIGVLKLKKFFDNDPESVGDEISQILLDVLDEDTIDIIGDSL